MHLYCASPSRWTSVRQRTSRPCAVVDDSKMGGRGREKQYPTRKLIVTAWLSARKFSIYFCWPSDASNYYFLGQSKNRHLCPISITFVRKWTLWEEMPLKWLVMHCKSVSCNLILGNLLIFWILKMIGGIKQSLRMCYQKSHRGIARARVRE